MVVKLDPSTGVRLLVDAQRDETVEPEQITMDMEFAQEGGEGPTPYEVLLHAALIGDSKRFTRQDCVEQCWRVMQPLLDNPPPVHPYAKGSWGPDGRRQGPGRLRPVARALGGLMSTTKNKAEKGATKAKSDAAVANDARTDRQADGRPRAAERGRPVAVSADRRLRVPVRLPHRRAGRAGRVDRLAVRAAV